VDGNARFNLATGDRVSLSVIGVDDDAIGWMTLQTNGGAASAKVLCATSSTVDGVKYAAIGVIFHKSTIQGLDRFATGVEYVRDGERRGKDLADASRLQLGSPACPTQGFAAPVGVRPGRPGAVAHRTEPGGTCRPRARCGFGGAGARQSSSLSSGATRLPRANTAATMRRRRRRARTIST
jgi:hypothetical protein